MHLQKAIALIESGKPLNIGFFTFDRSRGTGGEYIEGKEVRATGRMNKRGQYVNLLFQDNVHRKVHLKLITDINSEVVV